jgi:hypothetical protein
VSISSSATADHRKSPPPTAASPSWPRVTDRAAKHICDPEACGITYDPQCPIWIEEDRKWRQQEEARAAVARRKQFRRLIEPLLAYHEESQEYHLELLAEPLGKLVAETVTAVKAQRRGSGQGGHRGNG